MRLGVSLAIIVAVVVGTASAARADRHACLERIGDLGVKYERVKRKGIKVGVLIKSAIGGVEYRGYQKKPLVLDCSLVYSLAIMGRYLRAAGIVRATYSSSYQIRNVRGTNRRSKHSYGLAIDVHTYHLEDGTSLSVSEDYEQGLGDEWDCIGEPLTEAGRLLRRIDCQLHRSGLFRIVLTPDYDAGHYNHFHIEALPWGERDDA